jgi:hypothetical protein
MDKITRKDLLDPPGVDRGCRLTWRNAGRHNCNTISIDGSYGKVLAGPQPGPVGAAQCPAPLFSPFYGI